MLDLIREYQRVIGCVFIVVAVVLFARKAIDLGADAVPLLGEIMIGVVLFTVGYAFVMHTRKRESSEVDDKANLDDQ